jgi:hypothetical protein
VKDPVSGIRLILWSPYVQKGWVRGSPPLAKNERDAPNFLRAALDKAACAPFFKERRMKLAEPTNLYRKSGMWGTRDLWKMERSRRWRDLEGGEI